MAATVTRAFEADRQVVWDAVLEAARQGGMKVKDADPAAGTVTLTKGMSMRAWGEAVEVRVQPTGDDAVEVTASAKVKMQVTDWGQSQKTLDGLFRRIELALR